MDSDEDLSGPGIDDSAWGNAVAPSPGSCGWKYTPTTILRPHKSFEHPGTSTIWSAGGGANAWFRRSFDLPPGAVVASAWLSIIGDDEHQLYVNGQLAESEFNGSSGPIVSTDIAPYLVPGRNLVAVKAIDVGGGCRWLVIDGTVSTAPCP